MRELEQTQVPYMFVGSHASSFHGYPRTTADIDIVIDPSHDSLDALLARLPEDQYYVDGDTARDALRRRSMFNVIHYESGFKVDLIVRGMDEFDREEFGRRIQLPFRGNERWVATAEDTILSKLDWSKRGQSERQFGDAVNIARIQAQALDRDYLKRWAQPLSIDPLLEKLFIEVDQR